MQLNQSYARMSDGDLCNAGVAKGMTDIHARHVLFHMLGDANTASSRVRGYWIADELRALGYETSFFSARTRSDYLRLAWRAFRSDVVIFQKRYSRYDVLIARILNALGRPIFFDIDDVVDPIEIGNETSYKLRIVNQGTKTATNVQLQVDFPQGIQPTGVDGNVTANIRGQQIAFVPITSMNPGDTIEITIRGKGITAGDHRIAANLIADGREVNVSKQESTRVYSDR